MEEQKEVFIPTQIVLGKKLINALGKSHPFQDPPTNTCDAILKLMEFRGHNMTSLAELAGVDPSNLRKHLKDGAQIYSQERELNFLRLLGFRASKILYVEAGLHDRLTPMTKKQRIQYEKSKPGKKALQS